MGDTFNLIGNWRPYIFEFYLQRKSAVEFPKTNDLYEKRKEAFADAKAKVFEIYL